MERYFVKNSVILSRLQIFWRRFIRVKIKMKFLKNVFSSKKYIKTVIQNTYVLHMFYKTFWRSFRFRQDHIRLPRKCIIFYFEMS